MNEQEIQRERERERAGRITCIIKDMKVPLLIDICTVKGVKIPSVSKC